MKYKALQAEMENYKHDLDEARRTIEELQKQLLETTVSVQFHILVPTIFNMSSLQETPNFINDIFSDFILNRQQKDAFCLKKYH